MRRGEPHPTPKPVRELRTRQNCMRQKREVNIVWVKIARVFGLQHQFPSQFHRPCESQQWSTDLLLCGRSLACGARCNCLFIDYSGIEINSMN
jgi:hypothetical protein